MTEKFARRFAISPDPGSHVASPTSAGSSAMGEDSALLEWLGQAGGSCHPGVRIGENSGERGLFATKEFPANAMLLFVPADLHIRAPSRDNLHVDREDDRLVLELLNQLHISQRNTTALPVTIVLERWTASVPATYTTPLHWSDATIALLGDATLIATIERQRTRLRARYDALYDHIYNEGLGDGPTARWVNSWDSLQSLLEPLTFENYRWAYTTIRSRAAYLGEEGAAQAIVPETQWKGLISPAQQRIGAHFSVVRAQHCMTLRRCLDDCGKALLIKAG